MIPIIQKEVVEKRKWATDADVLDILAISESTPGPISINAATYIGFRVAGFWGSLFATLGLVLPSFVIIFVVSFFYKTFMTWRVVQAAFKGLSVGVIILLFIAVMKLRKSIPDKIISIILFTGTLVFMMLINIFAWKIPYVTLMLIGLGLVTGIVCTALSRKEKRK